MKKTAAFMLAVLAAAGTVVLLLQHRTRPLAALSRAIVQSERRPTLTRLVGLEYAPRPGAPLVAEASLAVRAAAGRILSESTDDPSVTAAAMVLDGRMKEAIALLEALVAKAPDNARLWCDLAAARYEDARTENDPLMVAKSLAAADRAIDLQPALAEALFNRAVILEALGLTSAAARANRRYLDVDSSSAWAVEVQEALRRTSMPSDASAWAAAMAHRPAAGEWKRLADRYPQQARAWAEGQFLAEWSAAIVQGNQQDAERWLSACRIIGERLREKSGETLLFDAVSAIDRLDAAGRARIAAAHVMYRDGRVAYKNREVDAAISLLEHAERRFARDGSPMRFVAAYYRGNALVDAHRRTEAAGVLHRLSKAVPPRYAALHAQLRWLNATLVGTTGQPYKAFVEYQAALSGFERLGEREFAGRMQGACASVLASLGQDLPAWRLRAGAFRGLSAAGIPWLLEAAINDAAREEIAAGRFDVARSLLRIELEFAESTPRLHFDALMWLAFVESRIFGTSPDLRRPRLAVRRIPKGPLREDALAELTLATARATKHDADAIALFSKVLDYQTGKNLQLQAVGTLVERARRYRSAGRTAESIADLERSIAMFEIAASGVEATTLRDSYFGVKQDAYADLAEIRVEQRRPEEALLAADRSRARVIADRDGARFADSIDVIRRRMSKDALLVHYTSFASKMFIVAIDGDGWEAYTVAAPRDAVAAARDRMNAAIESNDPVTARRAAELLYKILLAPVEWRLAGARTLIIIPDETTAPVAFAALRANGRWLIDRVAIAFSPAAAAFAGDSMLPVRGSMAIVADPAFDQRMFPGLERLGHARREAGPLRKLFPEGRTLAGGEATHDAAISAFEESTFIHVAAHALSDLRDASRSSIAMAPDSANAGVLHHRTIAELDLAMTRLVVLAGCRTAEQGGGRGTIRSLSLAFLAGGARSVVATLWDVEDEAASDLTLELYRHLQNTGHGPIALREAQLDAIRRGSEMHDWAGFQMFLAN